MKASDVRVLTPDQIEDDVLKLKKEQFNLRFQRATGQLENTARVRQIRRDIARLKTVAGQRRAAEAANTEANTEAKSADKQRASAPSRSPVPSRSKSSLKSRSKAVRARAKARAKARVKILSNR